MNTTSNISDQKWKKRLMILAEKDSECAPSLLIANTFEGKPDIMLEDSEQNDLQNSRSGHNSSNKSNKKQKNMLLYSDTISTELFSSEEEEEIPITFQKKKKSILAKLLDRRQKHISLDIDQLNFFQLLESDNTVRRKILESMAQKKKKKLRQSKQHKKHRINSKMSCSSKAKSIPSSSNYDERTASRKNRKANPNIDNINLEQTVPLSSSSPQKYIQFSVTQVYAAMPYSETLKRIIDVTAPNGINDVIDSNTMEYVTTNASMLRSNLDFTIFSCDEYPKQMDFYKGMPDIYSDITELRQSFDKLCSDVSSFIKENHSYIQKNHDYSTRSNNIDSEISTKILEDELPSKSVDEFVKFDKLLAESEKHRLELLNRYRVVICGESYLKNCVSKIMCYTLSKAVQSAYSGSGKKFRGVKKLNYSTTEAYKCLKNVLEEKFGFQSPDLKDLKARVGQWLSNYVSRNK